MRRHLTTLGALVVLGIATGRAADDMTLDDRSSQSLVSSLGTIWRGVSDRVMGGVSHESVSVEQVDGRECLRLTGDVRLENNGGFIQMALDLAHDGTLDASDYRGVRLLVLGNNERYNVHLRTPATNLPWQSYRRSFVAGPAWHEVELPFAAFEPYRVDAVLDRSHLRRLGIVAIGRPFHADLCVARVTLYR